MTYTTQNTADTQALARKLSADFGPGVIYALYGNLGAGKTCFVQGLTAGLGIHALVSSPTFAIANEYRDCASGKRFLHLDLYRLSGPDDLDSIGWDDYLDSGDTMAVEWPERAGSYIPAERMVKIEIAHGASPDERCFVVTPPPHAS